CTKPASDRESHPSARRTPAPRIRRGMVPDPENGSRDRARGRAIRRTPGQQSGCLVLLQLIKPNSTEAGQRMLSGPDPSVPVAQVPIDTAAAYGMAGIVRVGQSEAFENTEVRLDQVQPGGFGRRPRRIDAQLPQQSPKAR